MVSRQRTLAGISCNALIVMMLSLVPGTAFASVCTLVCFYDTGAEGESNAISFGSNWRWTFNGWVVGGASELDYNSGSLGTILADSSFDVQLLGVAIDRPGKGGFNDVIAFDKVLFDETIVISAADRAGDDGILIGLASNPILDSALSSGNYLRHPVSDAFSGIDELDTLRTKTSSFPSYDEWRR